MSDAQTIAVYEAQINSYLDLIEQQGDDEILLNFIARLPKDAYVLDLGCGPALASAVMRDRGIQVDPIDACAAMVKSANDRFAIAARQASFSDIQAKDKYQGVWANFSLLHASKDEFIKVLAAINRALSASGVLQIAMKLGSGAKRDSLGRFYHYYTKEELFELLNAARFSVDQIELGEDKGLAGEIEPWISICCVSTK